MKETTVYCSNCGAENAHGDRFCTVCGAELRQVRPGAPRETADTGSRASERGPVLLKPERVGPAPDGPARQSADPRATRIDVESASGELEPGTVFGSGRYKIEACLGTGGMGSVYRVSDLKLGETVALKVIHRRLLATGTAGIERLRNEVRMARRLSDPGIVHVFDVGSDQGLEFYTMEYVAGPTLREMMRARGVPFTLAETKRLLLSLLNALAYAHEQRTVHRDVKPENVLLADGDIGRPKLTDFGIAKALDVETLTRTAMALGTPEYVAPEQIHDASRVDGRADLFSVGVLLYEMLTGVRPAGVFEPPSELTPGLPKAVDKLVHQLLQRQPERRPSDAREVRRELAAIEECSEDQEHPTADAAPVGQEKLQAERTYEEIVLASKKRQARTNWVSIQRAVAVIAAFAAASLLALMLSWVLPDGTRDTTDNVAATPEAPTPVVRGTPSPAPVPIAPNGPQGGGPSVQPAPVPVVTVGSLVVRSNVSGDAVSIDGKHVGPSGPQAHDLAPGPHRVRVEKDGYEPYDGTVAITARGEETVQVKLYPTPAQLMVKTSVAGAEVRIDGNVVGTASEGRLSTLVSPGLRNLEVEIQGYEHWRQRVNLQPGGKLEVTAILVRARLADRATDSSSARVKPAGAATLRIVLVGNIVARSILGVLNTAALTQPGYYRVFVDAAHVARLGLASATAQSFALPVGEHDIQVVVYGDKGLLGSDNTSDYKEHVILGDGEVHTIDLRNVRWTPLPKGDRPYGYAR